MLRQFIEVGGGGSQEPSGRCGGESGPVSVDPPSQGFGADSDAGLGPPWVCPVCADECVSASKGAEHVRKCGGPGHLSPEHWPAQWVQCGGCKQPFAAQRFLQTHIKRSKGICLPPARTLGVRQRAVAQCEAATAVAAATAALGAAAEGAPVSAAAAQPAAAAAVAASGGAAVAAMAVEAVAPVADAAGSAEAVAPTAGIRGAVQDRAVETAATAEAVTGETAAAVAEAVAGPDSAVDLTLALEWAAGLPDDRVLDFPGGVRRKPVPACQRWMWQQAAATCFSMLGPQSVSAARARAVWRLVLWLPSLLLRPLPPGMVAAKREAARRWAGLLAGRCDELLADDGAPPRALKGRSPATEEARHSRAAAMVRARELRRAAAALETVDAAPASADTVAALRKVVLSTPHEGDLPPDEPPSDEAGGGSQPRPLQLDPEDLWGPRGIFGPRMPKRSAGDRDGWTFEALRLVADTTQGRVAVLALLNAIARGEVPDPAVAAWLRGGRLVALAKPQGGVRPIVVSSALRRAVSRGLAAKVAAQAADIMAPLQHAVGLRAGTEVGIASVRAALSADPAAAVVALDASNAFNEVSRVVVRRQLARHLPALLPYFDFLYTGPSALLLYSAGAVYSEVVCGEGLLQGDGLSPLLFTLAWQLVLERLVTTHRLVVGFADDITLVTGADDAARVVEQAAAEAKRLVRVRMNPAKTVVYFGPGVTRSAAETAGADLASLGLQPSSIRHGGVPGSAWGLSILGAAVGHPDYVREALRARVARLDSLVSALACMAVAWPAEALALLRYCAASKLLYDLRANPPGEALLEAAVEGDALLERGLRAVLGRTSPLPAYSACLASLPVRLGGLGIMPLAGLAATGGPYLGSVAAVAAPIVLRHGQAPVGRAAGVVSAVRALSVPPMGPGSEPPGADPWAALAHGAADMAATCLFAELPSELVGAMDAAGVRACPPACPPVDWEAILEAPDYSLQRVLSERYGVLRWASLYQQEGLESLPLALRRVGRARLFSGLSPGSGAAFTTLPSFPGQQLLAPVFRAALNSYLVLEVPGVDGRCFQGCIHKGCGVKRPEQMVGGLLSLHVPVCARSNRHVVHDRLKHVLAVIFREAGLGDVAVEPVGVAAEGMRRPGDVVGTMGDAVILADVTVVQVATEAGLSKASRTYGALTASREEDKERDCPPLAGPSMQWSPFVADSFGCLGARAHSLLDSLATWALMHGRVVVQDGGGRDPRPLLLDRWRSYVSCAVLGGMASRVLFYAARARPPLPLAAR